MYAYIYVYISKHETPPLVALSTPNKAVGSAQPPFNGLTIFAILTNWVNYSLRLKGCSSHICIFHSEVYKLSLCCINSWKSNNWSANFGCDICVKCNGFDYNALAMANRGHIELLLSANVEANAANIDLSTTKPHTCSHLHLHHSTLFIRHFNANIYG